MNTDTSTILSGNFNLNQLFGFNSLIKENHIILIYEGDFSQEVAKSVLNMTEKKLSSDNIEEMTKKKIYNVMIESLQNVCKHNVSFDVARPVFMIGFDGNYYNIITGNPIETKNVELLCEKIDNINSLDENGLKQLFKEARLKSTLSDVGGAGLGFIDMAKRTGNKLLYQFEEINDTYYYFTLMVQVSNN